MSEPRPDSDAAPYSRPPQRGATPTSASAQNAIIAGTVGLTGALALAGFLVYRSATAAPAPSPAYTEPPVAQTPPLPMPEPVRAPAPVPEPRPRSCRPYAGYVEDQKNPAVSEAALIEEAKCLCALAGGFTVRVAGNGLQQYKRVSACPTGSNPVPLEPDAKVWMGQWIDEPGHGACVCSQNARDIKVVVAPR